MRRLIVGIVIAAAAALVPTWALAGNQEVADQIAAALKNSGQLHGYRVGVKFQDGTAWLKGEVGTRDEVDAAMQVAFGVPGVTRVVNSLTVRPDRPVEQAAQQPVARDAVVAVNQVPLQAAQGAVTGDQRMPKLTRTTAAVIAPEAAPKQAQRLAMPMVAPAVEPQIEMTALEEPTLAPAKPAAEAPKDASAKTPQPMPYAQSPLPIARVNGQPIQAQAMAIPAGAAPARYDQPNLPNNAWPSYSAYPNYASLTYPKQYSPTAWPYIGPFYPYPQVPLAWRKVTLEWHDGWWNLDFDDGTAKGPFSGLFRPARRRY